MLRAKKYLSVLSFVFLWAALVGMGKAPGPDVPVPETSHNAMIRDDQDITTKVAGASWEGNVFFIGTRGKGIVTVAFDKIKKVVSTGSGTNNKSDFQVTMKSGDVVAISLDNDQRFMGTTSYGTYRILAKNIKEITFD